MSDELIMNGPRDESRAWETLCKPYSNAFLKLSGVIDGELTPDEIVTIKRVVVQGLVRGLWPARNWRLRLHQKGYL